MSADLLLEIGCEEIPSRDLPAALEQLEEFSARLLKENRINYERGDSFATPRRLVLHLENMDERQEDTTEKVKGPPVDKAFDRDGLPTRAALGFAGSAGVKVEDLVREQINQAEYLVVYKEIKGKPVKEILPSLIKQIIGSIRFSRSMYWERKGIRFARPIRWLLCLYGEEIVRFDFAGVTSGRLSYGHRIISPGQVEVNDPAGYFQAMKDNYVIIDHRGRKEKIQRMLVEKAAEFNGKALIPPELLEEVNFLVEYPVVIAGSFAEEFLQIPREVLTTSMQMHQRFFPVVSDTTEDLLPLFLGVSNNLYSDFTRRGYEKVLQARMADADFFYREDTRVKLEENVPRLQKVIFQESLGSLYEKSLRIQNLADFLGMTWDLTPAVIEQARRTAYLCKADLVTQMVREFPELQGAMGREYALLSGEDENVARALYEHYLPRFAGDDLPETEAGILVSLSDKMDTLAGCFWAGIQTTGSQDPYGLRRQALGVISILLEKDVYVSLPELVDRALDQFKERENSPHSNNGLEIKTQILDFLEQRISYILQEDKGLPHHVVEAVLAAPYHVISHLYRKAQIVHEALPETYFQDLVSSYIRVNNLARKAAVAGEVDESLLQDLAEKELWEVMLKTEGKLEEAWKKADYEEVLLVLSKLREPVDKFFDHVMVMTDKELLRQNRLNLLQRLRQLFLRYADFSLLQRS